VLGTNDAYWPLDAMNLYWADLSGPKSALYVPNAGHGLGQPGHVVSAVIALHRHALGRIPWPSMQWDFEQDEADGSLRLTLTARDPEPTAVNAWLAHSESRDFRKARWRVSPVAADADGTYRYRLPSPDTGYAAVFAEAVYDDAGRSYSLTSQVRIIPDTLPQEDAE